MPADTTTQSRIRLTFQPPAARLILCHPPLNVIDLAMMEELVGALAEIDARDDISALVLSGEGKAFSVGVDVAAHTPDKVAGMLSRFHAVIRALAGSTKVTIAAVHGHCLGGGAELAMVCDLVYTENDACWGFPEIKLGCYPPVAAATLAALIGQKRAADLILTGRTITGSEAERMGLVNRAVPGAEVELAVQETLQHLSKLSPAALAITRKACHAGDFVRFDRALAQAEKIYLDELMKTEDVREGINAFLEKRQPAWKGK